jgi:hypothetical protein
VNIHFAVHPDVEKGDAIRIAILAPGREPPAESALQHFPCPLLGHHPVGATELGRTHTDLLNTQMEAKSW